MERDFMGRVPKKGKQELTTESVPARSSSMQWSFSKNGSAPQFLSFKGAPEDRSRKTGYDSLLSTGTGYMTISTQRDLNLENQGGTRSQYTVPRQFGTHSRLPPITNRISQTVVPIVNQSLITYGGKNVIGSTRNIKQHVVPIGSTDLRNVSKAPGGPAQMTIFYGGSVRVFYDLSPEKAQAIMLMAGNSTSTTKNVPVISKIGSQPTVATRNTNNVTEVKPTVALKSTSTIPAPSIINALESAVPQARKASLTRFLEKRKERAMSTSPYSNNNSVDSSIPSSGTRRFSSDSSPLPVMH